MSASFVFDTYQLLDDGLTIFFSYALHELNKEYAFRETVILPSPVPVDMLGEPAFHEVLKSVHIALGLSYWKLTCAPRISFTTYSINPSTAHFWEQVYTKGLGEFYYKNKIDFRNLVSFPSKDTPTPTISHKSFPQKSLVGIGGGKDSLVSAKLLQSQKFDITGFVVETHKSYPLVDAVIEKLQIDKISVSRKLDPQIFELSSQKEYYNGHVPISVIYAFLGLLTAYVAGYSNIIVSNERSSNEGNVSYLGSEVNHQWSKSYEFEILLSKYIRENISSHIRYFSLLRPFSEIQITKLFTRFPELFSTFASCNKNFRTRTSKSSLWCGRCPKCAFTFILLASQLPRKTVIDIFGMNLLENPLLISMYRELLGFEGHKPFDCVGTISEARTCFHLIQKKNEYESSAIMKEFISWKTSQYKDFSSEEKEVLSSDPNTENIPSEFQILLKNV